MAGRFVRDPGFEAALFVSPEIEAALRDRCDAAAARARDLAPDDPRTGEPDLHTSVFSDVQLTATGYQGRVGATDFKAPWFEEGSARTSPRPFLRPAVEEEIGPVEAGERSSTPQRKSTPAKGLQGRAAISALSGLLGVDL